MAPHRDGPGLGLGLPLMRRLTDELLLISSDASDPVGRGTCVHATFNHVIPTERWHAAASVGERGELLGDYLRVLTATADGLQRDASALIAEAGQIVARSRRQRQERAERRYGT